MQSFLSNLTWNAFVFLSLFLFSASIAVWLHQINGFGIVTHSHRFGTESSNMKGRLITLVKRFE